jgi:hypothetical protein
MAVEIGQRIRRWLVLAQAESGRWLCRCECGHECLLVEHGLRYSKAFGCNACACRARNLAKPKKADATKRMPEYNSWRQMRARCHDPRNPAYGYYGGRGIAVCERWRSSFVAFVEDMGRRPSDAHSLDRIDVNGNYEPGNVRWATRKEQQRNRRDNERLTANGETLMLVEWADRTGIAIGTLRSRIRYGWSPDRTVSEHTRARRPHGSPINTHP